MAGSMVTCGHGAGKVARFLHTDLQATERVTLGREWAFKISKPTPQ